MRRGLIITICVSSGIALYFILVIMFIARFAAAQHAHIAWELSLPRLADLVPDLLSDGTLCCGTSEALTWVSPAGQVTARYAFRPSASPSAWMAGGGDLWFVAWDYLNPPPDASHQTIMALNRTAQAAWEIPLSNGSHASWICFDDQQVYLTLDNSDLCAMDFTGKQLWRVNPGTGQVMAAAANPKGGLYYTNIAGELVALDRLGAEKWRIKLGVVTIGYIVVAPDGRVLVLKGVGGSDLFSVGPGGQLQWSFSRSVTSVPTTSGPMLLPRTNYSPLGQNGNYYPALAADGTAYMCAYGSTLVAISTGGKELWNYALRGNCIAPAVGRDGTVYVAVTGQGVLAFTPQGKLKWRNTGLKDISSAPVVGSDGKVYVEVTDKLVALEP